MEYTATISRLPDSDLEALEDYIDRQDLDPDQMKVFQALLTGYGAAWDALEEDVD
ncbi:hypothetical protein ACHHV8_36570 [Paenibacillus sp. TAB 01]|uniref:hypothetical protein n=1 Tax=Paenibacillus sp. TAB 01 TaxID=3368988 RepID=UPI0037525F2F